MSSWKIGARVKASAEAVAFGVVSRRDKKRRGRVVGISRKGKPQILWDGLKCPQTWAPEFVELVARRAGGAARAR